MSRREKLQVAMVGAAGLEMGISVGIGVALGWYLDDRYGTEPIFLWIGFALGLLAAFKALYDAARRVKKVLDDDSESNDDA